MQKESIFSGSIFKLGVATRAKTWRGGGVGVKGEARVCIQKKQQAKTNFRERARE